MKKSVLSYCVIGLAILGAAFLVMTIAANVGIIPTCDSLPTERVFQSPDGKYSAISSVNRCRNGNKQIEARLSDGLNSSQILFSGSSEASEPLIDVLWQSPRDLEIRYKADSKVNFPGETTATEWKFGGVNVHYRHFQ